MVKDGIKKKKNPQPIGEFLNWYLESLKMFHLFPTKT